VLPATLLLFMLPVMDPLLSFTVLLAAIYTRQASCRYE
jgi:hypothetical protein